MPGPPPPPPMAPSAPPPPMFSAPKGGSDDRSALLKSIQKGTKLKKTVTNDKSAPLITGKTSNTLNSNNNTSSGPANSNNSFPSSPNGMVLGGLFAGGMPKLRPTGKLGNSPLINSTNNINNGDSKNINSKPATPTKNFSSIQNELKKQLAIASDNRNRGPPPPAPNRKPSEEAHNQPEPHQLNENGGSNHNVKPVSLHSSSTTLQMNNSMLHRKTKSNANLSSLDSPDHVNISNFQLSKPVINHGKPNLAPKPPILNGKPAPPLKLIVNGKPISRAHSMRSPRTPSPGTENNNKFGSVRHISSALGQALANSGSSPRPRAPLSSRPSAPPPMAPPPPPMQTNPVKSNVVKPPNHAPPPPPGCLPQPPSHAPPPPPPPHRTHPVKAPPAVPGNNMNSHPPPPPPRHSSMRESQQMRRSVVDLDERYRHMFETPDKFPKPPPYRNVLKLYLNKQVGSKQQAPLPPHLQSSSRNWDPTSTC